MRKLALVESADSLGLSGDTTLLAVSRSDDDSYDAVDSAEIAGLARYIREIGRFSFLPREEEIGWSRLVLAGQIAESRLANTDRMSDTESRALRNCVVAARSEAARLGIWSRIASERPIGWSESEHFAENVRLASLFQSGQIARFTLNGGRGLSAVRSAELLAEIAAGREASESLGLAWSSDYAALAQLNRLAIGADEMLRTDILLTSAAVDGQRLAKRRPSCTEEVERWPGPARTFG